jgi:hypothetical protein
MAMRVVGTPDAWNRPRSRRKLGTYGILITLSVISTNLKAGSALKMSAMVGMGLAPTLKP